MSCALKGIPKICWSTSLRKFSIRKCHLLGCVVSDHFFTGQRWYQQLPLYACSVSSVGPSLILTWSVGRPSDLSGLSNKSKLLVSQSSESGKTLVLIWVLNLFENQKLSPEKHANMYKLAYTFRNSSKDLRLQAPVRVLSLWFQTWEHIEKTFLFVMLPLCSRFRSVRGLNFLERGCHDYFQYLAYFKEFANVNWSGQSASMLINGSSGFYPMS